MADVVVFGTGSFAECVDFYLGRDSEHEVVAFTADGAAQGTSFRDRPVVPWVEVEREFPPAELSMFVAVGYRGVNRVRAAVYGRAKAAGYELVTYVSSMATTWDDLAIGDNCFVFEDNTIQPFVSIGDDVVLWSGNHVGHHASIGDHCFVTSHVVVSGHVRVGAYSFLGVNSTLRDDIELGESCVVGAGATIMESTGANEVYPGPRATRSSRRSDELGM